MKAIRLGSTIQINQGEELRVYEIVDDEDPRRTQPGYLSINSPLGRKLIDLREGAEFSLEPPNSEMVTIYVNSVDNALPGTEQQFDPVSANQMNGEISSRENELTAELLKIVAMKRELDATEKELRAELMKWFEMHPEQKRLDDATTGGSVRVSTSLKYDYDFARFRIDYPELMNNLIDAGLLNVTQGGLDKSSTKNAVDKLRESYEQQTDLPLRMSVLTGKSALTGNRTRAN